MVVAGNNMECNADTFNTKPGKQQLIYLFPVLGDRNSNDCCGNKRREPLIVAVTKTVIAAI